MMPTDKKPTGKIITVASFLVIVAIIFLYYNKQAPAPENTEPEYLKPLIELTESSTQEEKALYVEAVMERAKEVSSLEIGSCNPDPKIIQVTIGNSVDFMNNNVATRTISFSPANTFEIAPQSKRTIVFSFFDFRGVLEYSCDGVPTGKVLQIKPN